MRPPLLVHPEMFLCKFDAAGRRQPASIGAIDIFELRRETSAISNLDIELRTRIKLPHQRSLLVIEHQVDADVNKPSHFVAADCNLQRAV